MAIALHWCLGEGLVVEERLQHGECVLGLVHGHHVTGVVDLEEREAADSAHEARLLAVDHPRLVVRRRKRRLGRPLELDRPRLVAHVVADKVVLAGVDEHADAIGEHRGKKELVVLHPVGLEHGVHDHVALGPLVPRHAEGLDDVVARKELLGRAEVVAKPAIRAVEADVVLVHASVKRRLKKACVARELGEVAREGALLAALDELDAAGDGLHHRVVLVLRDERAHVVVERHLGIEGVLHLGVRQAVADANALEVQVEARPVLVVQVDARRDSGDIVAAIRLAKDVEVVGLELRVRRKELLEEDEHVRGHLVLVRVVVARKASIRKPGAGGLVDEDQVRVLVPRVRVQRRSGAVRIEVARAVFVEEGNLA
eukprot:Opistho-1_new@86650